MHPPPKLTLTELKEFEDEYNKGLIGTNEMLTWLQGLHKLYGKSF